MLKRRKFFYRLFCDDDGINFVMSYDGCIIRMTRSWVEIRNCKIDLIEITLDQMECDLDIALLGT